MVPESLVDQNTLTKVRALCPFGIGTSYPKIATDFQSLYLAEIFALLL